MSIEIKEIRDRTNLSQRDFAKRYGIPLSTLRKWEQGETTPASYIVRLLAKEVKGNSDELEEIRCKDGRIFYLDIHANTVFDSLGNSISIKESLVGVKRQNLPIYVEDFFDSFYEIQEKLNKDIIFDKKEDIIWS